MAYKASILDGYIIGIGKNNNDTGGITKEQYEEIDSISELLFLLSLFLYEID